MHEIISQLIIRVILQPSGTELTTGPELSGITEAEVRDDVEETVATATAVQQLQSAVGLQTLQ